jgi:superfamily II DNA or RNA helicase
VIGDGQFDPKHVTVATVQSLTRVRSEEKKKVVAKYLKTIDLLFLDETHHASAKTFYRFVQRIDAPWRYGLSGTPFGLADGKGLLVEAAFGPVVERVTNAELIALGVNAMPVIRMIEVNEPKLDDDLDWQSVYKEGIVLNDARNALIARSVKANASKKWPTLVLVRELWHGDKISVLLKADKIPHAFVHGQMSTGEVERHKERLVAGEIIALIASPIFGEGVDLPAGDDFQGIRGLVIADGGQSVANVLQKIGRGLRRKKGDNRIDVTDFADTTHKWLSRHSQERLALYESEGFSVIT